jgi:hypothetical protein
MFKQGEKQRTKPSQKSCSQKTNKIIQQSTKSYVVSLKAQHRAGKQELAIIDIIDWVEEALLHCGLNILGIIFQRLHFCWLSCNSIIHIFTLFPTVNEVPHKPAKVVKVLGQRVTDSRVGELTKEPV